MKKILLLLLSSFALITANSQWITNGPSGQQITGLASNAGNVFAASFNDGVYISRNNGGSWSSENGGLPESIELNTIAQNDSILFAGTNGYGVYISKTNAASWLAANGGISNTRVYSIAFNGGRAFAATDTGMYYSTNTGGFWFASTTGLPHTSFNAVAVADSIVFAGCDSGLYVSSDNGTTWAVTTLNGYSISTIGTYGANVYVGTIDSGVYLSTDTGHTWAPVNNGLPAGTWVTSFAINTSGIFAAANAGLNSVITGGIYWSANNGANWEQISTGTSNTNYTACLLLAGTNLYAGTDTSGVYQQALSQITTAISPVVPAVASFGLYPNPSTGNFVVETSNLAKQQLQIFDIAGQPVLSQVIDGNKTTIDAGNLAAGIYTISLKNSAGIQTEKLLISK